MTEDGLRQSIAAYKSGLEAELGLLGHLKRLAEAQQACTDRRDMNELTRIGEARESLLASLVTVEHEIRPIRQTLASHLDRASSMQGFHEVVELHRRAERLVAEIAAADQATLGALRSAEEARHFAAQAIEKGEATLAAYRRVVAPAPSGATLFNRSG